jgi:hypothetical protein
MVVNGGALKTQQGMQARNHLSVQPVRTARRALPVIMSPFTKSSRSAPLAKSKIEIWDRARFVRWLPVLSPIASFPEKATRLIVPIAMSAV